MNDFKYINLDYLNELALGSKEFKIEMIESFLKNTPAHIADMKTSFSASDYEHVGGLAHKLKTSFSFMGMDEMVKLSKEMQDDGLESKNIDTLGDRIGVMHSAYILAEEELKVELNSLQNG